MSVQLTAARRVGARFGARLGQLLPVRVIRRFSADGGGNQAVLIAWNALTSILPIGLALAAIGGLVLSVAGVSSVAIDRLVVMLFPSDAGAQAAALEGIEGVKQQKGLLAAVALAGFLWAGSGLFGAMEQVFAVIWRTKTRPFVRQKLMSLLMMGLFVVLAVLAVGTSALLPLLNDIPGVPISLTSGPLAPTIQLVIAAVSSFVLFFTLYYVVPNRRQRVGTVWPGALFAGVAFVALSQLFPIYIRLNGGMNRYGREFAFLFVLLAFFYFLGLITVLGAELNATLEGDPPAEGTSEDPPERPRLGPGRRAAFGLLGLAIGLVAGRRR